MRSVFLSVLAFACLVVQGCAVNPVTGKQDFVMMSESQELAMGRQANAQISQQMPMVDNPALQAYVQKIGEELARNSHRSNIEYRFQVVDSADINAFALPGGFVYMNRGLMAYMNSEAELGAVLGHEIGHVTARHGVRQQSMAMGSNLLGQLVTIGTGIPAAGDLSNMLGSAMVSGYGRDMELEADGLGAEYLARSGYRPDAVLEVIGVLKDQDTFARQQAEALGKKVEGYHGLFASHPTHDQRLQQVVEQARALTTGASQRVGRDDYLKAIEGMVYGDSAAQGVIRDQRFYHVPLNMRLDYPSGWTIINRPDVVLGHTPDESAFIAMTLETVTAGSDVRELLRQRAGGKARLTQEQMFSGSGYKGVMAILPGQNPRRVGAILRNDQLFLFIGAVRGQTRLETHDSGFVSVIRSFAGLSASDRKKAAPLHIRLVRAGKGDTYARLARNSPLGDDAQARLRLLNGHWPDGEPEAGQWLKVVK
ncbi:M48 family metalloprotease [uncultured Halopseudomonas sp.]|uniref:M48 family metalloprotease n=1 Tax=uncultured Halopseudomonas sp. TaxID=2901193 RepID=UPI0030EECAD3|tara:strand:+ start:8119 stop:9561 length:1443 start_codon:yes stop_codon:yes gene_type:complete